MQTFHNNIKKVTVKRPMEHADSAESSYLGVSCIDDMLHLANKTKKMRSRFLILQLVSF